MTNSIPQSNNHHVERLTWLRGFAALLVIVSHTIRATEVQYSPEDQIAIPFFISWFDLGSFGVVLFFALSGCTLYLSNREISGKHRIFKFYIKRFFRIWPAFVASIVAYIFFGMYFQNNYPSESGHWIEQQFIGTFNFSDIISYLTLSFNITGPAGIINNAYWSLPVEFQYYLLFPALIWSLKKFGIIGPIAVSAIFFIIPKTGIINLSDNSFFYLSGSFTGGIIVAKLYTDKPCQFTKLPYFAIPILIASGLSNFNLSAIGIPIIDNYWNWYVILSVLSIYLLLYTELNPPLRLRNAMMYYGEISYSTYLYHNLCIGLITLWLIRSGIHDGEYRTIITLTFAIISTLALAHISYKYIEKPFILYGRQVANKIAKRN